jgi:hypothetical protein
MARTLHEADVAIEGHLDLSLAKAIGMTNAEFERLESAAKTFNASSRCHSAMASPGLPCCGSWIAARP